ncbi:ATP-dependent RNA helicase HrpA [Thalassoglobus sp. JC818]|uniref:ATP-dependent RNA helicase HrpA n=1 Tax=Thalassoglobus sp. JC818 TaxID=3232136 RepID=UPI0034597A8A
MTAPEVFNSESWITRIDKAMITDRHELRRMVKTVERRANQGQPFDRSLNKLQRKIEQSEAVASTRSDSVPELKFDDALPVSHRREEILKAIQSHQVIVVSGETGSGKSTQLPKICLQAGRGVHGMIGHTQPRRIAARSVAARVAEELGSTVGTQVGYKIRFTDSTSEKTLIKLMTDGILLAESPSDRYFEQYDTIIIDEAHERSLNIDFLFGYLKRILPRRPDLKLIITSATIDAERFAEFFADDDQPAPIIEVSGRTYPVEVRYRPPVDSDEDDVDWHRAAADACEELAAEGPGDILVFMPTERDIRETARVLKGRHFAGDFENRATEILPLFGRLSEKDQNRVFKPQEHRRIVVATNVAESSLTVPGIVYVVDPGTARMSRFSATSQVQRLPIEPISQASANQRKGRCGRVAPGVCVRLYSEGDFNSRDEYTQPEIQRTNLASVILQMKSLKLGKIEDFPFINPPTPSAIRSGVKSLFALGAIDEEEELTSIGKTMSRLPVDPRIARMILSAEEEQSLPEVLIITSALELRDPRDRPIDKQKQADQAHEQFNHENSDFLSLLKLWDFFTGLEKKLSQSKLRKACAQNFLSYNRMREWKDLHRQLRDVAKNNGLKFADRRNNEDAVHRAILSGLLSNVALKGETHEYTGSGGQKLFIWPGSVAFSKKPKWIMAAELVETTKRYARCVAPVQTIWIERAAKHLVKKTYSDPHWHEKSACVMAFEKVLLFGLPIVPRRRCRYSHVDPEFCREQFINQGLMEGKYQSPGEFFQHNVQLKEELVAWQAKLRQGQYFSSEDLEFDFYDQRLPKDIFDGPRFEKWRKVAEEKQPDLLFLQKHHLELTDEHVPRQSAFPDEIRIGTMQLPVQYHLDPGSDMDGVTLQVPVEGLNQLSSEGLFWLVPGLLEDKVAALIKTLPKALRILFVPAPETAKEVVQHLNYGQGDLLSELAVQLRRVSGEHVPVSAFEPDRIPDHLHFNIRVVDDQNREIASGRNLEKLRQEARQKATGIVQSIEDKRWKRDGITSWEFGDLPQQVSFSRGGVTVVAFPMLVDRGESVSLRLAESQFDAQMQTRRALVRLVLLEDQKRIREQVRHLPRRQQILLQASTLPDGRKFEEEIGFAIAQAALFRTNDLPRNRAEWDARLLQTRNQYAVAVQDLIAVLEPLLQGYHSTRRLLERKMAPATQDLVLDLKDQLADLVAPGFLSDYPLGWLGQYPRYFQAMEIRWNKATTGGFQKDRTHQRRIDVYWRRWKHAKEQLGSAVSKNSRLVQFRFLIEEFRVSTFAQQLGTAVSVSEKKLDEVWQSITQPAGG